MASLQRILPTFENIPVSDRFTATQILNKFVKDENISPENIDLKVNRDIPGKTIELWKFNNTVYKLVF